MDATIRTTVIHPHGPESRAKPAGPRPPSPREGALRRQSPELRWEGLRDKAPTSTGARARPREGAALCGAGCLAGMTGGRESG